MFATIFKFEVKRWITNPSFYIYLGIFFLFSLLIMASSLGVFDSFTVTTASNEYANSPIALNNMLNGLSLFLYFLLPTIIGASVYRDFKYNMHTILFSYPFTKANYLLAKFFSSFFIVTLIVVFMGVGAYLASFLPFVNEDLLGPQRFMAYVQSYVIFILPNLFFYGVIVFSVVTITRNISVGFITVLILLFVQSIVGSFTNDVDNRYLVALLDPFGSDALSYITKYWTVYEKNENLLPFEGVIIYNRLIWLGVSLLIFGLIYKYFSFNQTALTLFKTKNEQRVTKNNFGGITTINLPKVNFDYSFKNQLKTANGLSNYDFKFIVKNWVFISIILVGFLFIFLVSLSTGQIFGTSTYPVTWQMLLLPGNTFGLFINILTFLFTGMLIHRGRTTRMSTIVDTTPTPNWVFQLSHFLAIVKMQIVLLLVVMLAGIIIQISKGYYHFEIGLYLKELLTLKLIHYVIWALLAVFIHTLIKNYMLGFFMLLVLSIGINYLSAIGIEQTFLKFNSDSRYDYSDMNGYGSSLTLYLFYKLYWLLLGIVLFGISLLFYVRGVGKSLPQRFAEAKTRLNKKIVFPVLLSFIAFLALGFTAYYQNNVVEKYQSDKDLELQAVNWEKTYKKYQKTPQPRITDVKVNLDLFPKQRNLKAEGTYILKNKTQKNIDTLFVNYSLKTKLSFSTKNKLVLKDTLNEIEIYKLEQPIKPGDSIQMRFEVSNKPNSMFHNESPVLENGTFLNNSIFPSFGYDAQSEIMDDDIRKKYGLKAKERMPLATDSIARMNTYISNDSDWINFETTVSTSSDQTAIAPGYLQKKWQQNDRNYFHYKMDKKILNFYAFNSARYEVKKDTYKGINLEIYYHKGHEYNLDRMMKGMKKSLEYYTSNFSPYQFKQLRIVEFPRDMGTFAQSFANTIPFSEAIGFIAQVDDTDPNGVDYPFSVTSHETAHQWWAHQVIGANVQGATLLSESLSEYSSLKVLEHQYGKHQMRKFLKDALDKYLQGRTFEGKKEKPLMYNENQQYIHYNKGSLVLYTLSDYIGEKTMNSALKSYINKVAFQDAPYTNSLELVQELKTATPDSLKYLIADMFENITLYDNKIKTATTKKLANGKYQVDITFNVSKYKADEQGKRIFKNQQGKTLVLNKTDKKTKIESLPLQDYIELGIFANEDKKDPTKEKTLFLKKIKVNKIQNTFTIVVDKKPTEVGVDPYNKLIDTDSNDNRKSL